MIDVDQILGALAAAQFDGKAYPLERAAIAAAAEGLTPTFQTIVVAIEPGRLREGSGHPYGHERAITMGLLGILADDSMPEELRTEAAAALAAMKLQNSAA